MIGVFIEFLAEVISSISPTTGGTVGTLGPKSDNFCLDCGKSHPYCKCIGNNEYYYSCEDCGRHPKNCKCVKYDNHYDENDLVPNPKY